jgi:two-component system OmpR family response regulator
MTPVIAIVDDEEVISEFLENLLKEAGYATVTYRRAIDAYQLVDLPRLDLVLLDLRLDTIHGSSMILALLQHDLRTQHVPIVLMSADSAGLKERRTVLEAKGFHFLNKPFEIDTLLAIIADTVSDEGGMSLNEGEVSA